MRIKQLELIKYGKFSGETLPLPASPHDFHVIVGPNEAGKSTVRSAVVELLFGMPARTPLSFLHDVSELRLGGVIESGGIETAFHRARGRTQLRTPDDERLPDDLLTETLDGISKEFFEQMFSLDHDRLLQGGKSIINASDSLGQVLFESAAGVGSLGPVRLALEELAGNLWAPRRTQSSYAQAEARFSDATTELKGAQVRTRVWVEARDALQKVTDDIDAIKAEQLQLETLRSKLERVRRLAPFLQEAVARQIELDALGEVTELPASAYDELVRSRAETAAARKLVEEREAALAERLTERESLSTDDTAIAAAGDIEALETLRGASVNHERDLPLRRAERDARLKSAYDAAAQLGWPTERDALQAALPKALALRTVRNLLRDHGALEQAAIGAQDAMTERSHDLDSLEAQLRELKQTVVPGGFHQVLAEARELRNSDSKAASVSRTVSTAERRLEEALAALGQWRMSVDQLRTLDLPSTARLTALQRQETELSSAVTGAKSNALQAASLVEDLQLEERQFAAGTKVVTTADVLTARGRRDAAWNDLKGGAVSLVAGAAAVDSGLRLADELVDAQLGTTRAAADLQSLRNRLEAARLDDGRKVATLDEHKTLAQAFDDDWGALVTAAGLPGMPLSDLPAWLEKREVALSVREELEQATSELADIQTASTQVAKRLADALKSASVACPGEDLKAVLAVAESFASEAASAVTKEEGLKEQVRVAQKAKEAAQGKADKAADALAKWKTEWDAAIEAANLSGPASTLATAEAAIDLASEIAQDIAAAQELQINRIDAMEQDIRALEEQARHFCEQLAPDLAALEDAREVARSLTERLKTARETAATVKRADEALKSARLRKAEAESELAVIGARIDPLLQSAGVESIDEALPVAQLSDRRRLLIEQIEKARSTLIQDGDGLTQESLASQIGEYDLSQVPALLEEVNRNLAAVNDQRSAAMQLLVTANQAFEAINGRSNAAVAEAKRQEALATMGDVAEQYLEVATAARLLKWATDRYRDQKQGPMLKRAGEIFSGLTLGQFSKLGVNAEANPPSLYAKRSTGALVEVSGLSEGTRDQLFLSLRIAALELQLRHKKPLPFIADDLFINFDDERAKAGLAALKDLSRVTQVLFLTHHDHLLPLVHEVFGGDVNVVPLEREVGTAVTA